jgi:parallel beta-helix repeat protein
MLLESYVPAVRYYGLRTNKDVYLGGILHLVGGRSRSISATGVNDNETLQTYVNAIGLAGGGDIFLNPGTYQASATVNILYDNIRIHGAGPASDWALKNAMNATVFRVGDGGTTTVNNVHFDNFQISGNKSNQTLATYGIYFNKLVHDSSVRNMYINDLRGKMIYNDGLLGNRNMRNQIKNNLLVDCSTADDADDFDCIDNQNNDYTQIIGNICITPGDDGIDMGTGDHCKILGNTVFGNSTATGIGSGIETDTCGDLVISGNNLYKCADYAIRCENQKGTVVTGNNIYLSSQHGIDLKGAGYCVITGNHIRRTSQVTNNSKSGIYLQSDGSTHSIHNRIANNFFYDDGSNKAKYHVEESTSNQDNNTVENNTFIGAVTAAVLRSGASSTFKNNVGLNPGSLYVQGNVTGATTLTRVNGATITTTSTGNVTTTITDGVQPGDTLTWINTQDGVGGRTISKPANTILVGGAFTPSAGIGAVDSWTLQWNGTAWVETSRALNLS